MREIRKKITKNGIPGKGAATVYTNTRTCPPGFPKHGHKDDQMDTFLACFYTRIYKIDNQDSRQ